MRYKIFENGVEVNTIIADEDFVSRYCEANGYTYQEERILVLDPAPTVDDRIASLETETEILKTQVKTIADSDKVNSGTYTGTGLYGESNPNSVRPNIPAKVLMIIQNNETILTLSRTESTDEPFVWFASSAKEQCNENGLVYNWIAVS